MIFKAIPQGQITVIRVQAILLDIANRVEKDHLQKNANQKRTSPLNASHRMIPCKISMLKHKLFNNQFSSVSRANHFKSSKCR
jgi:hypothetical protein